jgi:catechol 2,3-dioxygenase-like lactoylglutathione lyase family enzyme
MLDHVGFAVSDCQRSKGFYEKAREMLVLRAMREPRELAPQLASLLESINVNALPGLPAPVKPERQWCTGLVPQ